MQPFFHTAPVGKLRTPSTSNGLDQLRGKGRPCSNNSGFHCLGFSARYLHGNVKPSLALCQSGKAGFAFALAAHCRTRFPVTGFLTAVYRLVSFSNRLPFAVFPPCFFHSMALPFAPQHFQAAVYQIFFYRFNDRSYASRASAIRKGRGQSVLATRSLLICHLCSQSLPANGIFPGDSRSGAAGASCALCAGSKPGCHAGTVSAYLPRHCARIPANQPGNLTAAQAIHVIFPYTTALFYAKMMAVHTVPSSGLVVWLLHSATGGPV